MEETTWLTPVLEVLRPDSKLVEPGAEVSEHDAEVLDSGPEVPNLGPVDDASGPGCGGEALDLVLLQLDPTPVVVQPARTPVGYVQV